MQWLIVVGSENSDVLAAEHGVPVIYILTVDPRASSEFAFSNSSWLIHRGNGNSNCVVGSQVLFS